MKKFIFLLCLFLIPKLVVAKTIINSHAVTDLTYHNSPQAKSIKLDNNISHENYEEALAQYDTYFSGIFSYEKNESERATPIMGTSTSNTGYNFGLSQLAPTGTQFDVGFYNTKSSSNSQFAAASTLYDSRFYFGISQPLLNNVLGYQNRQTIKLAKQNIQTTKSATKAQLSGLVYQNLQYYWSWYLYNKLISINKKALEATKKLYRTNKQKLTIGLIEEADIYAFAANLDMAKANLIEVESGKVSVESNLKSALNLSNETLLAGKESPDPKIMPNLSSMIVQAKKTNPEYLSLENALKTQNIVVAMKKNERLPQLDLTASLTLNGVDPTYANAFEDIADNNSIWTAGINLTIPIRNKQARANYNKEKLKLAQALFQLKDTENKIIAAITQGLEKYKKTKSRMAVIATAVKHQKLKWEGEIKRYDQGRSDPDLVIRYQNDYLDTQKMYVQAQVNYFLARLDLDYYMGNL